MNRPLLLLMLHVAALTSCATPQPILITAWRADEPPDYMQPHVAALTKQMLDQIARLNDCTPRARFVVGEDYIPFGISKTNEVPEDIRSDFFVGIVEVGMSLASQGRLRGSVLAMCRQPLTVNGLKLNPAMTIAVEASNGYSAHVHLSYYRSAEGPLLPSKAIRVRAEPMIFRK